MKIFYQICVLVLAFVSVYSKVLLQVADVTASITSNELSVDIKSKHELDSSKIENATATDNATKTCYNILDIDNFIDTNDTQPCPDEVKVDNGTALLLTPYVEDGRFEEARAASKVDPTLLLGFESYSGFITVNETYNSNIFFWYFPSVKPANETPWIIWLQGGPGASSLTGLFDELGPVRGLANGSLIANPYTWLQNHSLVFIDSPVGSGYSFTDHPDGYAKDMDTYAKHLYTTVKQLVQIYPELSCAPLYIAGESYAGKYVPALGAEIHRHRDVTGHINLKGLMIGNAYVQPEMITQIVRPFYNFGLVEQDQLVSVKPLLDGFLDDVANHRSVAAKEKWNTLIFVFLTLSYQRHGYNFLRDEMPVGRYAAFLAKSEVKRAIHVGDIGFHFINFTTNVKLNEDFLSSAQPLFEELLDHYRVLAFCGHLDQMLPCASSSETYRTWKWNHTDQFLGASRMPMVLNRRVTGYSKSGGGLTWAVIRGAGHMAALDAAEVMQTLVSTWVKDLPLPTVRLPSIRFNMSVPVANKPPAFLPAL